MARIARAPCACFSRAVICRGSSTEGASDHVSLLAHRVVISEVCPTNREERDASTPDSARTAIAGVVISVVCPINREERDASTPDSARTAIADGTLMPSSFLHDPAIHEYPRAAVAREPRLSAATNMTGGARSAPRVFCAPRDLTRFFGPDETARTPRRDWRGRVDARGFTRCPPGRR